jgi:HK97 gp10 family phage protein
VSNREWVKLEGGDALLKALREADGNVRKAQRGAIRAGGELIKAEAQRLAPASRRAKRVVLQVSSPRKGVVEARVKPSKRAWYLKFFETGVGQHEIPSAGKRLVFEGREGLVVTNTVVHPGMPARPFLRPAIDGQHDAAVAAVGESLRQALEEARIAQAGQDEED